VFEEKIESPDPLFETQKRAIFEIWDQMQRLQTDFALAQELTFYHTSSQWHAAKRVLDLGAGNGYYLRKIAAHFPNKIYHGVDVSAELLAIAEREAGGGNVSFSHRNLFDVTEPYDFVLMRLLLQHLDDIQAVLDHVAGLTSSGKSALIIDAHDPFRFFHPDLPEFMKFFTAYAEHERKAGRDRCVASRVEQAIMSSAVWRLGATLRLLIPSTIAGNLSLFTRTYTLLIDLVEQGGELQYDFSAVKEAWRQWSARPDAYTQVGLNLIGIDRV
jgi:ubiquinone/menaquinone biosynthesis C-methylase UbiE